MSRIGKAIRRAALVGGVLFLACPSYGLTLNTLFAFNGANGSSPLAGLTVDSAGDFYGTTFGGGASNVGTAFKFSRATSTLTTLAEFNTTNGAAVRSRLIFDTVGNLYGVASEGGPTGNGVVFTIAAGTNALSTVASFNGTNGSNPFSGVVADVAGNLYGTTSEGGANNLGVVYKIAAGSNVITPIVNFSGPNGANPRAVPIIDNAGNLYGTTRNATSTAFGTVFKLSTQTNTLTTLASFTNSNTARNPDAGVFRDASGNLYGATFRGGTSNQGAVFKINAANNLLTKIAEFNTVNGGNPYGGVIMDAAGNLYGTSSIFGASNLGTVFKIAAGTNTIMTLVDFNGTNGARPSSDLFVDSAGNLYGTTLYGGPDNLGTIFQIVDSGFVVPEPTGMGVLMLIAIPTLRRRA